MRNDGLYSVKILIWTWPCSSTNQITACVNLSQVTLLMTHHDSSVIIISLFHQQWNVQCYITAGGGHNWNRPHLTKNTGWSKVWHSPLKLKFTTLSMLGPFRAHYKIMFRLEQIWWCCCRSLVSLNLSMTWKMQLVLKQERVYGTDLIVRRLRHQFCPDKLSYISLWSTSNHNMCPTTVLNRPPIHHPSSTHPSSTHPF